MYVLQFNGAGRTSDFRELIDKMVRMPCIRKPEVLLIFPPWQARSRALIGHGILGSTLNNKASLP